MPVLQDQVRNRQAYAQSSQVDCPAARKVQGYEIMPAVLALGVTILNRAHLIGADAFFAEQIFQRHRIAFESQGTWDRKGGGGEENYNGHEYQQRN